MQKPEPEKHFETIFKSLNTELMHTVLIYGKWS